MGVDLDILAIALLLLDSHNRKNGQAVVGRDCRTALGLVCSERFAETDFGAGRQAQGTLGCGEEGAEASRSRQGQEGKDGVDCPGSKNREWARDPGCGGCNTEQGKEAS